MTLLRVYRTELFITALAIATVGVFLGSSVAVSAGELTMLETVFSFDNATVNAKYLERFDAKWRRLFMTVGVMIAVVGMRLLFPFAIVCASAHLSLTRAVHLALENRPASQPGSYGAILASAHPAIAAFGGVFLFLLFTEFVFDHEREVTWLGPLERPLQKLGRLDMVGILMALIALVVAGQIAPSHERETVYFSGLLGIITYLVVSLIGELMESADEERASHLPEGALLSGKAALGLFLFLEVMDASFSFDGVIGAFAITSNAIVVAIGLGCGALLVRRMTVHFVESGVLADLIYLEHGAMWAIGSLSIIMLASITYDIPDMISGLLGLCFVGAAFLTSKRLERADHGTV